MGKKKNKKGKEKNTKNSEEQIGQILEEADPEDDIPYLLSLYGKVDEEECSEIVHTLYGQRLACEAGLRKPKPIKLLISTHGGDAVEIFGHSYTYLGDGTDNRLLTLQDGNKIRIPHIGFSADLDFLDEFVNRLVTRINKLKG